MVDCIDTLLHSTSLQLLLLRWYGDERAQSLSEIDCHHERENEERHVAREDRQIHSWGRQDDYQADKGRDDARCRIYENNGESSRLIYAKGMSGFRRSCIGSLRLRTAISDTRFNGSCTKNSRTSIAWNQTNFKFVAFLSSGSSLAPKVTARSHLSKGGLRRSREGLQYRFDGRKSGMFALQRTTPENLVLVGN